MHILSPVTDNCPSWISRRGMAIEINSWSVFTKVMWPCIHLTDWAVFGAMCSPDWLSTHGVLVPCIHLWLTEWCLVPCVHLTDSPHMVFWCHAFTSDWLSGVWCHVFTWLTLHTWCFGAMHSPLIDWVVFGAMCSPDWLSTHGVLVPCIHLWLTEWCLVPCVHLTDSPHMVFWCHAFTSDWLSGVWCHVFTWLTLHTWCRFHFMMFLFEPHHEKTCLRGVRPGKTLTSLLSYRDQLEAWNFRYRN